MKSAILCLVVGTTFSAFAGPVASGTLTLSKSLTTQAKGIQTLFLSVYDAKSPAPMPCAAQKILLDKDATGDFLAFALDTKSMTLMGCPEIPKSMNIKAKLDKNSSAGRDATGDIIGTADGIKQGAKGVKITLDKLIP